MKAKQREELLRALHVRFDKNMNRHKGLEWVRVQAKLESNPEKLWSLNEMERTGGEPDVIGFDKKTGEYIKRWSRGKKLDQKIPLWIWRLPWASRF